jgi:hypothetical protein
LGELLFRQEEGSRREENRRRRDNEYAFRRNMTEDIWKNGVSAVIIVLDCVDGISVLVRCPNLTSVRPESRRHYGWSFKACACVRNGVTAIQDISIPVNLKDSAVLTRYDHVVVKCAYMIECNPVLIC